MAIFVAGCATYPVNPSLKQYNPAQGYRYETLTTTDPNKNSEQTFIILTFSGGGTRAAALSYGVLEHLHKAPIAGGRKTLLDEVDVISSVSGGSFTAAYYGLFGEEKFFRDYKEGVLHRRIEHELLLRVLAPWNWPWLLSPYFGRSDLADEYYDRYIFEGRTYAQMPTKRPFIIINATDMSLGAQFSFIQDHFDRLCSDLSQVHVSRAVVASSAFPVAFTPITLNNYPKTTCGYTAPRWVASGLQDFAKVPSRYDRAKTWVSYEDAERRPYIHLNDGGLADNIGLRGPEVAITTSDSSWSLLNKVNNGVVKRLAVIIVDAKPQEATTLDDSARRRASDRFWRPRLLTQWRTIRPTRSSCCATAYPNGTKRQVTLPIGVKMQPVVAMTLLLNFAVGPRRSPTADRSGATNATRGFGRRRTTNRHIRIFMRSTFVWRQPKTPRCEPNLSRFLPPSSCRRRMWNFSSGLRRRSLISRRNTNGCVAT
jgi:NTE family protein